MSEETILWERDVFRLYRIRIMLINLRCEETILTQELTQTHYQKRKTNIYISNTLNNNHFFPNDHVSLICQSKWIRKKFITFLRTSVSLQ